VARRPLHEVLLELVEEGVARRICWRGWWTVRRGVVEGFLRVAGLPIGRTVSVGFSFIRAVRWLLATVVIVLLLLVWPYTSHEARLCYALCGWLHTRGAAG